MAWLAKLGAGIWAKLALIGGIVAAGAIFVNGHITHPDVQRPSRRGR